MYAANKSEIKVLGAQSVQGLNDNGNSLDLNFQVLDKLSKPLASVWDIVHTQNRVVFDEPVSYIENKKTGRWTKPREEGKLYYLDVWIKAPKSDMPEQSFIRQVAS